MATQYIPITKEQAQEWHNNYKAKLSSDFNLIKKIYGDNFSSFVKLYTEYKAENKAFKSVSFANESIDTEYIGKDSFNSVKLKSIFSPDNFLQNKKYRYHLYLGLKDLSSGNFERVDILCHTDTRPNFNDPKSDFFEIVGTKPVYNTQTLNGSGSDKYYAWICDPNCFAII
jgi:hypothetical protein